MSKCLIRFVLWACEDDACSYDDQVDCDCSKLHGRDDGDDDDDDRFHKSELLAADMCNRYGKNGAAICCGHQIPSRRTALFKAVNDMPIVSSPVDPADARQWKT